MRILKKSLALLLALTMIASLVVVSVSATEDTKVYIGNAQVLKSAEAQTIKIPVFLKNTAATAVSGICCELSYDTTVLTLSSISFKAGSKTLCTNEDANFANQSNKDVKKIAGLDFGGYNHTFEYADSDLGDETKANFAVLTFSLAANAPVNTYTITGTMDTDNTIKSNVDGDAGEGSTSVADQFTVVNGTITVSEEQWISSTEAVALGDIQYGATAPDLPATVKGIGQTSGGTPITAGDNVELAVTWGTIDTFVEPADGKSLAGTVTATETDLLKFKNADGTAATLTASATYDIIKSTAGVVAPVTVEVKKRNEGAEIGLEAIKALEEVVAATSTTIAIEGGETETVTLDWASATVDPGDTTLNTSLDEEESIIITVPVTGTTTYYDLTGKTAAVTVTMVPAEIAGGEIVVKGQRATAIPEVTAVIPADAVTGETCDVKIIFYSLTAEKALGTAKETITANVPVTAGQKTIITRSASQNLKAMGFDEVGEEFAVQVLVNNAALKVGEATFITDKVVASTSSSPAGIGTPSVPAKPQTPVVEPEEPGTEEPGTEEPGTEEPGTEEPGTEEPGTEEPGTEEPGTEEPATGFEDVTAEFDWAAESINKLADLGVINGKGDNKFAPNDDITRAEFTKMIVTLLGLDAAATETAFADCAADDWFTPYIIAAVEAGVVTGVADDAFAPNDTITREQACTILGRALALAGEGEATFADAAEISDYAAGFVAALAELGIINGYEDGSFAPANNITRAEAAKILAGALDVIAPVEDAPVEDAPVEEAPAEEVVEEVVAE